MTSLLESFINPLPELLSEIREEINDTHLLRKVGEVNLFVPRARNEKPAKFIAAGYHGDEPAGPVALLEWVKKTKISGHIYLAPIVSLETHLSGNHKDDNGKNVNLEIPKNPAREIKGLIEKPGLLQLMTTGGFLSLQEDPYRPVSYLLVWKNKKPLVPDMVKIIKRRLPLDNPSVKTAHDIKDNTTLGKYVAESGAPVSISTETSTEQDFDIRVEIQLELLDRFLQD